jgi:PAS domain S-box-containing protein
MFQQQVAQQLQQNQQISSNQIAAAPASSLLPTSTNATGSQPTAANSGAMQPPGPVSSVENKSAPSGQGATAGNVLSESSVGQSQQNAHIVPMPSSSHHAKILPSGASSTYSESSYPNVSGDKKEQKRAANRRSAQLSRKRKKRFIEELKEENDDLRRKEQILRSIPDLIVVFDSAGKLWFVSRSVSRFLEASSDELEGTSFWECLCEDSVRLLKAAFMDALAARKPGMDTTPLGEGVWELRLLDRDGTNKVVTLNGVVHFSGDAPECVCSIRPRDEECQQLAAQSTSTNDCHSQRPRVRIEPHQSVINNSDNGSVRFARGKASIAAAPAKHAGASNGGMSAARISDPDSGSAQSESGSEE